MTWKTSLPHYVLIKLYVTIRVALLTYKHKTHVINYDGTVLSNADVDFYVDDVSYSLIQRTIKYDTLVSPSFMKTLFAIF